MRTAAACLASVALLTASSAALAKKAPADKFHCAASDGSELSAKSKKDCKKQKGKWEKVPAEAPAPAAAPAGDSPPAAPIAPPPP